MANNTPIRLNFFPLINQEFSYRVYRQKFSGQEKQEGYYKAKLPQDAVSEQYSEYWVTTQQQTDFERVSCLTYDNPTLTLKVVWDAFLRRVKEVLQPGEYILDEDPFTRQLHLVIARHPEGNEVIEIGPYFLKSERKFGFLADFKFRTNDGVPYNTRIQQLSLSIKGGYRINYDFYNDKYEKLTAFKNKFKNRIFPFRVDLEDIDITESLLSMRSSMLNTKKYIFNNGVESNSQYQGIKVYGPLVPLEKEPFFVFIFEPNQRDQGNALYSALIGKAYPETFPGIERLFGLKMSRQNIKQISIDSLSQESLRRVENDLRDVVQIHSDKAVIGIFIIDETELAPGTGFSPYHYLKFLFTKHQVPLQTVRFEKIMKDGLKWSVANIGLQIFAKLGGRPWKVKPSNDKCLIFGLGSAHKWGEDGKIKKFFAYSVCMDSSGIYRKINVLGDSSDRKTYIEQLRENIKTVISEELSAQVEKCAVHLPFKIKKDEMDYIRSGIRELADKYSDIDFQFIKINTKNKFFGYAENNSKVPYESSYLQLAPSEFLVWFDGLQFGKEIVNKRIGNPVHIEFLHVGELDAQMKQKYLQDILNLSGANWRGFNSKLAPISTYYPELIAEFIAQFREFNPQEDIDLSRFEIPWFL